MIRILLENEDHLTETTFKTSDAITWADMIVHFAEVLNGVTYVIDTDVLREHLEYAADQMRSDVYEKVKARQEPNRTSFDFGVDTSEAPF